MCFDEPAPPSQTIIQAPTPQNYGQQTRDTLQAQIDLAPQLYSSEAQFRPQYAALDTKILGDTLLGTPTQQGQLDLYRQIYPQVSAMQSQAQRDQRTSDIADVLALGPKANDAFRASNPQLTQLLDMLDEQARTTGPSAIEQELQSQALDELKLRGQLSPDEMRSADQAAARYWADKGLPIGTPALASRLLNRENLSNQRQQQRQNFAGTVDQLTNQRVNADRSFAGNVTNLVSANTRDPFLAILGRPSNTAQIASSNFSQAGYALNSGPKLFNPESGYAQNVYDSNFNADAATKIAQGNLAASIYGADSARAGQNTGAVFGLLGSLLSSGGSVGGAALAACWVAREVYGVGNLKWILFREWMFGGGAPRWLSWLYLKFGERFARFISDKPMLKNVVRKWMDSKIGGSHAV